MNRGELDITGDNNSNGVQVTPGPKAGQFTVTGLNDNGATTINGQPSVTVSGVTDDTKINLGDGNDNLTINNGQASQVVFPNDLKINIGSGTDTVSLTNVTVDGKLEIQNRRYDTSSASGNDTFTLGTVTVLDDTQIQTGNGNDTVQISGSTFGQTGGDSRGGDLEVDFGNGTDSLTIQNSTVVGQFKLDEGGALTRSPTPTTTSKGAWRSGIGPITRPRGLREPWRPWRCSPERRPLAVRSPARFAAGPRRPGRNHGRGGRGQRLCFYEHT